MEEFALNKLIASGCTSEEVQKLALKIPESLHGLFYVSLQGNKVTQLRLQPDGSIQMMNHLIGKLNQALRIDGPAFMDREPIYARHGQNLSRTYDGDELKAILNSTDNISTLPETSVADLGYVHCVPTQKHYAEADFVGSFTLDAAAKLEGLSVVDRRIIHTMNAMINDENPSVRGAFTVDVVRNQEGQSNIVAFAIAPNMVANVLAEGLLKPVVDLRREHSPSFRKVNSTDVLTITHHRRTGGMFDRDDLLRLVSKPQSKDMGASAA
jgi:hypothetical protein